MPAKRNNDGVIINASELTSSDVVGQKVLCPACQNFAFKDWPEGWDAHAEWKCSGTAGEDGKAKKQDFRSRFGYLFVQKIK